MVLNLTLLLLILIQLRSALRIQPRYAPRSTVYLLSRDAISNNPFSKWDQNKKIAVVVAPSKNGQNVVGIDSTFVLPIRK